MTIELNPYKGGIANGTSRFSRFDPDAPGAEEVYLKDGRRLTNDVAEELAERAERNGPPADLVAAVASAQRKAEAANAELTDAVKAAREAGDSWADIGSALGTSRQNAYQRFGRQPVKA